MNQQEFTVRLEQIKDFEFRVKFDSFDETNLLMDEPEPLGGGAGPNASRVLAAAVGNCLTASLLFCARKTRTELRGLRTEATARLERNAQNRWRVQEIAVAIDLPASDDEKPAQVDRCLALFEDYCVVTASVKRGIPVRVEVRGPNQERLYESQSD